MYSFIKKKYHHNLKRASMWAGEMVQQSRALSYKGSKFVSYQPQSVAQSSVTPIPKESNGFDLHKCLHSHVYTTPPQTYTQN